MTREEEIKNGAIKSTYISTNEYYGFIDGAHWADEHPKSPWISVKESLPKSFVNVVILGEIDRYSRDIAIDYVNSSGEWDHYINVDYWMPIPELPKRL